MLELQNIIITFGYIGIFVVVFAESGFLFGFFLPGDSLLFTLGLLASQGMFNVWLLVPLCAVGAILGDSFGYFCGEKFGPKIFNRPDSFFFHEDNIKKTEVFYQRHGVKTIILARFIPIVRTFAPILAGLGGMSYKTFISFNVIGGVLWTTSMLLGGYFLGSVFPQTEKYLSVIIITIVVVSLLPIVWEFLKDKIIKKNKI